MRTLAVDLGTRRIGLAVSDSGGKWATPHEVLVVTDPDLVFVDERLSSFAAEQQLNDRKRAGEHLTRKRRKQQLDAVAAAGFLQSYLDGALPGYPPDYFG
jgi:RNase H-fold protein (predicted Holliday junction resolvase)